jgi:hypothetical protein
MLVGTAVLTIPCLGDSPGQARDADVGWERFSALPIWDDGLSEMSYYDATDVIYGVQRKYTRVHLLNREWMDAETGVKAEPPDHARDVAVFKFTVAEEIPTENYNYRYLITAFARRPGLEPFKLTVSSQDWCGHTFKHLRWRDDKVTVQSFSYFDDGDRQWDLPGDAVPFELLPLLARAVAASGTSREVKLVNALRSNRGVEPQASNGRLATQGDRYAVQVPAGRFEVHRVALTPANPETWFEVESDAPFRLVAFQIGRVMGRLRLVERRAYWDRAQKSAFYAPGAAP